MVFHGLITVKVGLWFSQQCMGASFPYSLKMSGLNQKASEELVERIQSEWFMQPYAGS